MASKYFNSREHLNVFLHQCDPFSSGCTPVCQVWGSLTGAVTRSEQTRVLWRSDLFLQRSTCCRSRSCSDLRKSSTQAHRLRQELQHWTIPKICPGLALLSGLKVPVPHLLLEPRSPCQCWNTACFSIGRDLFVTTCIFPWDWLHGR